MPKKVDHETRRREIAEAVWRIAVRAGLEGVTMRQVAAEAGVSTRLVQYYFGTRAAPLAGAYESRSRFDRERLEALVPTGGPVRATLRTLVLGLLPLDDEGRTMYLVHVAYFVRALSDRHLTALFGGDTDYSLEHAFTRLLEQAEAAGDLRPGVDTALEAERLLALQDGMSSRLLLTMRSAEQAERLLDYHLGQLFVRESDARSG